MPKNNQGPLTFDKALKGFVTSTTNSMKFARMCANLAISHFAEHGDVIYAQNFVDAMPKNYIRKAAFLKWLAAFSPVIMIDGKLAKDKADTAVKFDVEEAHKVDFWDFAPDMEMVEFDQTDILKALKGALKKFENHEKYKPHDAATVIRLEAAKNLLAGFEAQPAAVEPANNNGETIEGAPIESAA